MKPSSARALALVQSRVHDGLLFLDEAFQVVSVNERYCQWTGFGPGDVVGRSVGECFEDAHRWQDWMASLKLEGAHRSTEELDVKTRSGDSVPVEAHLSLITGFWKRTVGALLVLHDLRPSRLLEKMVMEDAMTGVASRALVLPRLESELSRGRQYATPVGVVLLDVDRFQAHNDRWGPSFGDEVLRVVGAELRERIRPVDTVGRIGSDEFLWVLPQTGPDQVRAAAEGLRAGLERRLFAPQGVEVPVTASLGATVATPTGHDTVPSVLARVDAAQEQARRAGRNRVELIL